MEQFSVAYFMEQISDKPDSMFKNVLKHNTVRSGQKKKEHYVMPELHKAQVILVCA